MILRTYTYICDACGQTFSRCDQEQLYSDEYPTLPLGWTTGDTKDAPELCPKCSNSAGQQVKIPFWVNNEDGVISVNFRCDVNDQSVIEEGFVSYLEANGIALKEQFSDRERYDSRRSIASLAVPLRVFGYSPACGCREIAGALFWGIFATIAAAVTSTTPATTSSQPHEATTNLLASDLISSSP